MIIPIRNVGQFGVHSDAIPHALPPAAWTAARNVYFDDDVVCRRPADVPALESPPLVAKWAMYVPQGLLGYWLLGDLENVYSWNGDTFALISRDGGYAAIDANLWHGALYGGIPILCNGVDVPQYWPAIDGSTLLADLPNWPVNTFAGVIKPFKEFLIALSITSGGVFRPKMVKWSHRADPGSVPISWDPADTTLDAGETYLDDNSTGGLLDCAQLGDLNIIYSRGGVWRQRVVPGSTGIFEFRQFLSQTGIVAQGCAKPILFGRRHVVAAGDDLIVHDGLQAAESVLSRRMRRWLVNTQGTKAGAQSWMIVDTLNHRVIYGFPVGDADWPTLGLVWDWVSNTTTVVEFPATYFAAEGVIPSGGPVTFDAATGAFDDAVGPFDPQQTGVVYGDITYLQDGQLNRPSAGSVAGLASQAFCERRGLNLYDIRTPNEYVSSVHVRKFLRAVHPILRAGSCVLEVGTSEFVNGTVTWKPGVPITAGAINRVDVSLAGRLFHVRFSGNSGIPWELEGYDLDIEVISEL